MQDGKAILSSVVASQIAIHHPYGGVVPELASRKHIESVVQVVEQALFEAKVRPQDLDAVAATQGPGLIGSLLVGFTFAKGYAHALNIPWIGVNHLEGHIESLFLTDNPPPFPFVALLVSGGHTSLYHVTDHTHLELLGRTRDDAAGEAYDKVSKMLNLGYPGGEIIDRMAALGNSARVPFPRPYIDKETFDFSFSGLKTAVNRHIQKNRDICEKEAQDIASGFQEAVVEVLSSKLMRAAEWKGCRNVAIVGGVAANSRLRQYAQQAAAEKSLTLHIPPPSLCGDNAAMIAAAGYHHLKKGRSTPMDADVFSRAH